MSENWSELNENDLILSLEERLKKSKNPVEIATILKKIAYTGELRALPLLKSYLSHEDTRVRANAIEGLGFFKREELVPFLFEYLQKENDARIRGNILKVLWKYGSDNIYNELEKMLFSGSEEQVRSGLFVAEQMNNEAVYWIILRLSKKSEGQIRKQAVETLKKLSFKPISRFDYLVGRHRKKVIFLIIVIAISAFYGLYSLKGKPEETRDSSPVLKELMTLIKRSMSGENYSLAISNLNLYLRHADDPEARFLLGKCYYKLTSYQIAEDHISMAWRNGFVCDDTFVYLARIYSMTGAMERLPALMDKSSKTAEDKRIVELIRGYSLKKMGKWDEALDLIDSLESIPEYEGEQLELKKECERLLAEEKKKRPFFLANKYFSDKKYTKSAELLKFMLGQDPGNPQYILLLAKCYLNIGLYQKARDGLLELLRSRTETGRAYALLADSYFFSGEIENAYLLCMKGLSSENVPDLHLSFSRIFRSRFRLRKAQDEIEEALRLSGKQHEEQEYILQKAELLAEMGRISEAQQYLSLFTEKYPDWTDSRILEFSLAVLDKKSGLPDVLHELGKLSEQNPSDLRLKNLSGITRYRLKHFLKAEEIFSSIFSDAVPTWKMTGANNMAICKARNEKVKEAESLFFRALNSYYSHRVEYNLACMYYGQGNYEEAANGFLRVIEKNNYDIDSIKALSFCLEKLGRSGLGQAVIISAEEIINNCGVDEIGKMFDAEKVKPVPLRLEYKFVTEVGQCISISAQMENQ